MEELLGRLCGSGVTNPRRTSTRQMDDTDGTDRCLFVRWYWIVEAPASKPSSVSDLGTTTISSSTLSGTLVGDDRTRNPTRMLDRSDGPC